MGISKTRRVSLGSCISEMNRYDTLLKLIEVALVQLISFNA